MAPKIVSEKKLHHDPIRLDPICSTCTWSLVSFRLPWCATHKARKAELGYRHMTHSHSRLDNWFARTKQSVRCIVDAMIDQLRWNGGHKCSLSLEAFPKSNPSVSWARQAVPAIGLRCWNDRPVFLSEILRFKNAGHSEGWTSAVFGVEPQWKIYVNCPQD